MTDLAPTDDSSHEPAIAPTARPARPAANDNDRGVRVPPAIIDVPLPANDNLPPLPVKEMRMALPLPGITDQDVYDAICERISQCIEQGDWKARRIATEIEARRASGQPLTSHNGNVSCEPLVTAAGLNARDADAGTEVRSIVDTCGQALVSFPLHTSPGCRFSDPVAALYAVRVWGTEIGRYGKRISLRWLKDFTGVPVSAARQNRTFKLLHREWLAGGRIAFADVQFRSASTEQVDRAAQIAAVHRTLEGFDVPSGGLPASSHRHGAVDVDRIAELSGVPSDVMQVSEIRRAMVRIRAERGVRVPGFDFGHGHLAHLFSEGLTKERQLALSKDLKAPEERVSGFRTAFMHLLDSSGCTTEDLASEIFGDDRFEAALARAASTFDNAGTRRNFMNRCRRWKSLYDGYREVASPAGSFAERLVYLMGQRSLSRQQVGDVCGCSLGTVRNWLRGGNVSIAMMPCIAKLEDHFDLPAGELCSLIRKGWKGNGEKEINPYWSEVGHRFARLLPPEVRFLSRSEIEAAVARIEPLVRNGSDYAILGNAARSPEYRLHDVEIPDLVLDQIVDHVSYKTANVVAPLLRAKKGRWRETTTIEEKTRELHGFFRFLLASCSEDAKTGLGIDPKVATFAWLAVPELFLRYFSWQASHLADVQLAEGARGEVFTSRMRHFAWTIRSLTHPKTGYLTQLPEMANTLQPIEKTASSCKFESLMCFARGDEDYILGPADIELACNDWKTFVAVAYEAAGQVLEYIDDDVAVVRDTMANAKGLLHGDQPLGDYLAGLFAAEERIRTERSGTFLATDMRNLLMCEFSLWTGFRPKNVVDLVYTGGDDGQIWKEDGVWKLRVPYRNFKNWKSCLLFGPENHKQDYRAVIGDDPRLSKLLDEWFFDHRLRFADGGCDRAFPTKDGNPMNSHSWYEACRKFGAKYIAWNPITHQGIRGVVSINPYLHRVIKATDILVNSDASDRVLEAAHALQTSPDMIQSHYAIFIPERGIAGSRRTHARARAYALGQAA